MRARYPFTPTRQRNGEYYFIPLRADKQGVPLKQLSSWLQRHKKLEKKEIINKHLLHQVVFFCCLPDAQQTRQFETRLRNFFKVLGNWREKNCRPASINLVGTFNCSKLTRWLWKLQNKNTSFYNSRLLSPGVKKYI